MSILKSREAILALAILILLALIASRFPGFVTPANLANVFTDTSPFLQWTLAVIAGGGAAGMVQAGTVLVRGASSFTTAGLANPVVSTVELGAATITSILSLLAPIVAVTAVLVLMAMVVRRLSRGRPGFIKPERRLSL